MSAQHTPGPWVVVSDEWTKNAKGPFIEVRTLDRMSPAFSPICRVRGDRRFVTSEQMKANANLIAAAPALLMICEQLIACHDEPTCPALDLARAIVKSARGEA